MDDLYDEVPADQLEALKAVPGWDREPADGKAAKDDGKPPRSTCSGVVRSTETANGREDPQPASEGGKGSLDYVHEFEEVPPSQLEKLAKIPGWGGDPGASQGQEAGAAQAKRVPRESLGLFATQNFDDDFVLKPSFPATQDGSGGAGERAGNDGSDPEGDDTDADATIPETADVADESIPQTAQTAKDGAPLVVVTKRGGRKKRKPSRIVAGQAAEKQGGRTTRQRLKSDPTPPSSPPESVVPLTFEALKESVLVKHYDIPDETPEVSQSARAELLNLLDRLHRKVAAKK
ncbi:hypothetical protein HOP50_04g27890 [Chloropicon primus]|nr:hypothetical protein HOP50_04g27890 [Chloropicon primus]